MTPASNSAPTLSSLPDIEGLQLQLLGQLGSQRGVELAALSATTKKDEIRFTTIHRCFGFLPRMSPVCLVSVDQRPYERLGPLSFFAPGVPTVNKGIFATGVTCIFNAPFMNHLVEIERDLHFGKIDALAAIDSHRLTYLGQEMLREALSPGFGGALRAQAMGMEAVLEITRCDGALRVEDNSVRGGLASWQTRRLEAYVREHLANDVTLTDLADLLGMSVRHLSRVVKQAKGRSVHCWVADLRIAEAQRLLSETNLPLHEIARRVAFKGAGAFSTAFRAASGFTPSDFRRLTHKVSATAAKAEP